MSIKDFNKLIEIVEGFMVNKRRMKMFVWLGIVIAAFVIAPRFIDGNVEAKFTWGFIFVLCIIAARQLVRLAGEEEKRLKEEKERLRKEEEEKVEQEKEKYEQKKEMMIMEEKLKEKAKERLLDREAKEMAFKRYFQDEKREEKVYFNSRWKFESTKENEKWIHRIYKDDEIIAEKELQ